MLYAKVQQSLAKTPRNNTFRVPRVRKIPEFRHSSAFYRKYSEKIPECLRKTSEWDLNLFLKLFYSVNIPGIFRIHDSNLGTN